MNREILNKLKQIDRIEYLEEANYHSNKTIMVLLILISPSLYCITMFLILASIGSIYWIGYFSLFLLLVFIVIKETLSLIKQQKDIDKEYEAKHENKTNNTHT